MKLSTEYYSVGHIRERVVLQKFPPSLFPHFVGVSILHIHSLPSRRHGKMRSVVSTSTFRQAVRSRPPPSQSLRFASSTTETAQKKAQDALGSAQKTAEKLWESSKKILGPLGERAGTMLGCMSFVT